MNETADVDEEVKSFFEEHALEDKKANIQKVSCCYDCSEKLALLKKMEKKIT